MSFTLRVSAASVARLGFNGELHEAGSQWQILGNGYRIFNPVLARFHSPDSLSPFEDGGFNAYCYCGCDPVNLADPTGHFLQWIGLGAAVGAVATGVGALAAANAGNDALANRLGQFALGLGIGAVAALAGTALVGARGRLARDRTQAGSASRGSASQADALRAWGDDAPKLVLRADRIVLQTHAGPFANAVIKNGKLSWVDAAEQARMLKAAVPQSQWGKPVQLVSCFPGLGGSASSAQRFSDVWGGPVLGSRRNVFSDHAGHMVYTPKHWRLFEPQTGIAKQITAATHGTVSVPAAVMMRTLVAIKRLRAAHARPRHVRSFT